MSGNGGWSVDLAVPGPVFEAVGRNGGVRTVDCRKVTCGIITVSAHGVKNARNETFTPLKVGEVYDAAPAGDASTETPAATPTPTAGATSAPTTAPSAGATPPPAGGQASAPALEVDRASARAGNALAFTGAGLPAGKQVTVVFDDGAAASGPFLVGSDGSIAGVVLLPAETAPGTHELRVFGIENPPTVNFAVARLRRRVGRGCRRVGQRRRRESRQPGCSPARPPWCCWSFCGQLVWRMRRSRRATA